jgi:hypothetical protein
LRCGSETKKKEENRREIWIVKRKRERERERNKTKSIELWLKKRMG